MVTINNIQKGFTVMDETRLDKIEIKELEVFANHGVYPEENVLGQKFVISATLFTRTRLAGLTDELSASINYGEVSHMITDFTRKHTYKLLESLAENLAEMLLCSLSGLEKITLKIEKPWAPVGLPLKTDQRTPFQDPNAYLRQRNSGRSCHLPPDVRGRRL